MSRPVDYGRIGGCVVLVTGIVIFVFEAELLKHQASPQMEVGANIALLWCVWIATNLLLRAYAESTGYEVESAMPWGRWGRK